MKTIESLSPQNVWRNFHLLTQVPHPSGLLAPVQQFICQFAENLKLEYFIDEIGNVIVRKPATSGMENRKMVTLQAHTDMVPQKNNDKVHDFEKDPITTIIDGEWVRADETTLGADNGMGVAAIMSVLEDNTLKHGPIEALFTCDEETHMVGAFGLQPETIQGEILLNLDSEDEGELYIGCAGGEDLTATLEYKEEVPTDECIAFQITLKGLRGGHSGLEINQGRGNANKLMARILNEVVSKYEARLSSWQGGNMRNAIPREAHAVIVVPKDIEREQALAVAIADWEELFNVELAGIETPITVNIEHVHLPKGVAPAIIQDNFINAVFACQNGVLRNITTIPDTVETSSNLSIVKLGKGNASVEILARSSCDSMKEYLINSLQSCFAMAEMKVELSGAYSGWQPNVESPILHAMKKSYQEQFGVEPAVKVVHAGLECGIIGAKKPGLDMISFGPTIRSPHSPAEKCHIDSVRKFYEFLVATLEQTPLKD
jgi:dipeptidase D